MRVNAKVILKENWETGEGRGIFIGRTLVHREHPLITFEMENRRTVSLIVPNKIFNSVSIGSKGVLEYSGKKFYNFIVGETAENNHADTHKRSFKFRL